MSSRDGGRVLPAEGALAAKVLREARLGDGSPKTVRRPVHKAGKMVDV